MILYEVWQVFMSIDDLEARGLSFDDIMNKYYEHVWYADYIDCFNNIMDAQECMKRTENSLIDGLYTFEMRYIDKLEYEDDDENLENGNSLGIIEYYVKEYD